MLHYNVHFDFREGVDERQGMNVVNAFLEDICRAAEIAGFSLLINQGTAPRTKLQRYQALIEFRDSEHLSATMEKQAKRGVHAGAHGEVVKVVTNFHVEMFETIDQPGAS